MLHIRNLILLFFMLLIASCQKNHIDEVPGSGWDRRYGISTYIVPDKILINESGKDISVVIGVTNKNNQTVITEESNPKLFKTIAISHGETGEVFKSSFPRFTLCYGIAKIQVLKDGVDISDKVSIYYYNPKQYTKKGLNKDEHDVIYELVSQLNEKQLFWCPSSFLLENTDISGIQIVITLSDGKIIKTA